MTQCSARSKRTKERCRAPAMANGKCYHHGGSSKSGTALPQTTHGRYSKDLPTRLGERFLASRSDPDLLNLNAEIALIDARLGDLLRRVDSGESGELWKALKGTFKELEQAKRNGDDLAEALAFDELGQLVSRASADYEAWIDVRLLVEQRRKLVDSEGRRRKDMQDMITSEKAMLLVTSLVDTVRRHVRDRDTLAAISADLARLFEQPVD